MTSIPRQVSGAPDIDVSPAFSLGVPNYLAPQKPWWAPWGHKCSTHSFGTSVSPSSQPWIIRDMTSVSQRSSTRCLIGSEYWSVSLAFFKEFLSPHSSYTLNRKDCYRVSTCNSKNFQRYPKSSSFSVFICVMADFAQWTRKYLSSVIPYACCFSKNFRYNVECKYIVLE